jgi:hypothetical protein
LDDDDSNSIAGSQDRCNEDKLRKLLEQVPAPLTGTLTAPSPATAAQGPEPDANGAPTTLFDSSPSRTISFSEAHKAYQLVPLLCDALLCGLHNFKENKNRQLSLSKQEKTTLERFALKFESLSGKEKHKFEHGELSATVVGTPPTASSTQFYVICFIASGSTSKVFQAVNNSGNLCVIKMYIKRYEEKFWIDENEFATNAAESVEREVGNRISI